MLDGRNHRMRCLPVTSVPPDENSTLSIVHNHRMKVFSVLDLAFVVQDATPAEALRNTLDLAQHAERWGYRRYWLAEHHNMIGIASAATAVVIGYLAGNTRTIRVG